MASEVIPPGIECLTCHGRKTPAEMSQRPSMCQACYERNRTRNAGKPKPRHTEETGPLKPKQTEGLGWKDRTVEPTVGPTCEPIAQPTNVGPTVGPTMATDSPTSEPTSPKNQANIVADLQKQIAELQEWQEIHERLHASLRTKNDGRDERLDVLETKVFTGRDSPDLSRSMDTNLNRLYEYLKSLPHPGTYVQPGVRELFRCSDTYADKIRDEARIDKKSRFIVTKKTNDKSSRWFIELKPTIQ